MECNFWMTNLSSVSLLSVICCQSYRFWKWVNIVLWGITEESGLDHFPFITLLRVSVHLTVHSFGEEQMGNMNFFFFNFSCHGKHCGNGGGQTQHLNLRPVSCPNLAACGLKLRLFGTGISISWVNVHVCIFLGAKGVGVFCCFALTKWWKKEEGQRAKNHWNGHLELFKTLKTFTT